MKKLLESSAVQIKHQWKKCNTSATYSSPFWIMIGEKTMRNFVGRWYHVKTMTKNFVRKLWKTFSRRRKNGFKWRKMIRHFLHANVFMCVLLISDHTVFLVLFEITLHLWAVWKKTHSCKLIPNWTRNLCKSSMRVERTRGTKLCSQTTYNYSKSA